MPKINCIPSLLPVVLLGGAFALPAADATGQQGGETHEKVAADAATPLLWVELGEGAERALKACVTGERCVVPLEIGRGGGSGPGTVSASLAVVHVRKGRVIDLSRSEIDVSDAKDVVRARLTHTNPRADECCIEICYIDTGKCHDDCVENEDEATLGRTPLELPAVQAARALPRVGDDFGRFIRSRFDREVELEGAVYVVAVPEEDREASVRPLLLGLLSRR